MGVSGTDDSGRQRLGRYYIGASLGTGPLGEVFRADAFGSAGFEGQFALKLFHPDLVNNADKLHRLVSAAGAASRVVHPNVATVHEFSLTATGAFLVSDLVNGIDILSLVQDARRRRADIPAGAIVRLFVKVARALGHIHELGMCHLGISPGNVICDTAGELRVTDAGFLAIRLPSRPHNDPALDDRTPYLAPEQLAGEKVDLTTDVYQLGVLVYEALTGRRPFLGNTIIETAQLVMSGEPAPTSLPPEVSQVLIRAMDRTKQKRYANCTLLAEALDTACRAANLEGARAGVATAVQAAMAARRKPENQPALRRHPTSVATTFASMASSTEPGVTAPLQTPPEPHGQTSVAASPEPEAMPAWNLAVESSSDAIVRPVPSPDSSDDVDMELFRPRFLGVPVNILVGGLLLLVASGVGVFVFLSPSDDPVVPVATSRRRESRPAAPQPTTPIVPKPVLAPAPRVEPRSAPPVETAPARPAKATVAIEVDSPTAFVFVDGQLAGQGTVTLPFDGKAIKLAVLQKGFALHTETVTDAGAVPVRLLPVAPLRGPAGIKVVCKESNRYYVFVDGKDSGQLCPTERLNVSLGHHDIEIYDPVTDTRRAFQTEVEETRLSKRVHGD